MRDEPNGRGLSRKAIFFELDESLRRLETDYVDLYQIHRWDYETPIEETLEALHDVVKAGKVRYIGASSMYAWQFAKALYLADLHGWTRFVSMQNHYNLLYREEEREMMPLCRVRRHRRHSLEPAGARPPGPPLAKRKHQALRDRPVRQEDVLANRRSRPQSGRPPGRGRRTARRSPRPGGAGLAARQAGRSPRRLSAPPSRTISRTPSPRSRCTSRPKRLPLSKSRTRRIRYLASAELPVYGGPAAKLRAVAGLVYPLPLGTHIC